MNVFIDCGFYGGRGWNLFKQTVDYKPDFKCYGFDPTPRIDEKHQNDPNVVVYEKVVYTYDGTIDFFCHFRQQGRANAIYRNPKASRRNTKIKKAECIDFGKWIMDNFSKDDFIVVKMDIEGAENVVLEKMIQDGSIHYIDILYLEPHNKDDLYKANTQYLKDHNIDRRTAIEWCYKKYR